MVYFNPRTHEGYDKIIPFCFGITIDFNPRTHEGYDLGRLLVLGQGKDFNPRTHEGYDCQDLLGEIYMMLISIHVPTKGTTRIYQ